MVSRTDRRDSGGESRLESLGITLPNAPTPLGSYVEVVEAGGLLFLSGMLPVIDHKPAYVGKIGKELDLRAGQEAARVTAANALATAKGHLGTLDRVKRIVRLGVFMVTADDFADHPAVTDNTTEHQQDKFGEEN